MIDHAVAHLDHVLPGQAPILNFVHQITQEDQMINADQSLQRLMEGNKRFMTTNPLYPNLTSERRAEVAKGQNPFAIIFGCVDSRVPPELVFDQGLGDLFVIRTAGQALDDAVLGSIQFGVEELNIPLVMVLLDYQVFTA